MTQNVDVAFLVSGGGTTLQNVLDHIEEGELDARVIFVISSDPDAYALVRAKRAGIPSKTVNRKEYDSTTEFSRAITNQLMEVDPDLVCMGGFLHFYEIPEAYRYRVMNIHPALLPDFGGKGFYKDRVHRAVLESGVDVSGCTVHFATNEGYDEGPVILQKEVPVQPDDTVQTLRDRVFEKECEAYPEAIQLFAEDRIRVRDGEVEILDRNGEV